MLRSGHPGVLTTQPPAGKQSGMVTGHVLALAAAEGIVHRDAAASCLQADDRHGEGTKLGYHGMVLTHLREFKRAIPFLQDAAAILRETSDRSGEGQALRNLGIALRGVGRSAEAITALQDAAAIFREAGDRYREGQALRNLRVMLQAAGQSEEAITASQDTRQCPATLHRRTGWEIALAICFAVLALGVAAGALSDLSGGSYVNFIYLGLVAIVAGGLATRHRKR
jgi:tetratricopeptide (TPR) repeat protein